MGSETLWIALSLYVQIQRKIEITESNERTNWTALKRDSKFKTLGNLGSFETVDSLDTFPDIDERFIFHELLNYFSPNIRLWKIRVTTNTRPKTYRTLESRLHRLVARNFQAPISVESFRDSNHVRSDSNLSQRIQYKFEVIRFIRPSDGRTRV